MKEKKKSPLFDHLKNISQLKIDTDDYLEYNSFMTNRFLSMVYDTALYANEMNRYHSVLVPKFQYEFLVKAVPKKNRFFKYFKKEEEKIDPNKIKMIKQYYEVSSKIAIEILDVITPEHMAEIEHELTDFGGID